MFGKILRIGKVQFIIFCLTFGQFIHANNIQKGFHQIAMKYAGMAKTKQEKEVFLKLAELYKANPGLTKYLNSDSLHALKKIQKIKAEKETVLSLKNIYWLMLQAQADCGEAIAKNNLKLAQNCFKNKQGRAEMDKFIKKAYQRYKQVAGDKALRLDELDDISLKTIKNFSPEKRKELAEEMVTHNYTKLYSPLGSIAREFVYNLKSSGSLKRFPKLQKIYQKTYPKTFKSLANVKEARAARSQVLQDLNMAIVSELAKREGIKAGSPIHKRKDLAHLIGPEVDISTPRLMKKWYANHFKSFEGKVPGWNAHSFSKAFNLLWQAHNKKISGFKKEFTQKRVKLQSEVNQVMKNIRNIATQAVSEMIPSKGKIKEELKTKGYAAQAKLNNKRKNFFYQLNHDGKVKPEILNHPEFNAELQKKIKKEWIKLNQFFPKDRTLSFAEFMQEIFNPEWANQLGLTLTIEMGQGFFREFDKDAYHLHKRMFYLAGKIQNKINFKNSGCDSEMANIQNGRLGILLNLDKKLTSLNNDKSKSFSQYFYESNYEDLLRKVERDCGESCHDLRVEFAAIKQESLVLKTRIKKYITDLKSKFPIFEKFPFKHNEIIGRNGVDIATDIMQSSLAKNFRETERLRADYQLQLDDQIRKRLDLNNRWGYQIVGQKLYNAFEIVAGGLTLTTDGVLQLGAKVFTLGQADGPGFFLSKKLMEASKSNAPDTSVFSMMRDDLGFIGNLGYNLSITLPLAAEGAITVKLAMGISKGIQNGLVNSVKSNSHAIYQSLTKDGAISLKRALANEGIKELSAASVFALGTEGLKANLIEGYKFRPENIIESGNEFFIMAAIFRVGGMGMGTVSSEAGRAFGQKMIVDISNAAFESSTALYRNPNDKKIQAAFIDSWFMLGMMANSTYKNHKKAIIEFEKQMIMLQTRLREKEMREVVKNAKVEMEEVQRKKRLLDENVDVLVTKVEKSAVSQAALQNLFRDNPKLRSQLADQLLKLARENKEVLSHLYKWTNSDKRLTKKNIMDALVSKSKLGYGPIIKPILLSIRRNGMSMENLAQRLGQISNKPGLINRALGFKQFSKLPVLAKEIPHRTMKPANIKPEMIDQLFFEYNGYRLDKVTEPKIVKEKILELKAMKGPISKKTVHFLSRIFDWALTKLDYQRLFNRYDLKKLNELFLALDRGHVIIPDLKNLHPIIGLRWLDLMKTKDKLAITEKELFIKAQNEILKKKGIKNFDKETIEEITRFRIDNIDSLQLLSKVNLNKVKSIFLTMPMIKKYPQFKKYVGTKDMAYIIENMNVHSLSEVLHYLTKVFPSAKPALTKKQCTDILRVLVNDNNLFGLPQQSQTRLLHALGIISKQPEGVERPSLDWMKGVAHLQNFTKVKLSQKYWDKGEDIANLFEYVGKNSSKIKGKEKLIIDLLEALMSGNPLHWKMVNTDIGYEKVNLPGPANFSLQTPFLTEIGKGKKKLFIRMLEQGDKGIELALQLRSMDPAKASRAMEETVGLSNLLINKNVKLRNSGKNQFNKLPFLYLKNLSQILKQGRLPKEGEVQKSILKDVFGPTETQHISKRQAVDIFLAYGKTSDQFELNKSNFDYLKGVTHLQTFVVEKPKRWFAIWKKKSLGLMDHSSAEAKALIEYAGRNQDKIKGKESQILEILEKLSEQKIPVWKFNETDTTTKMIDTGDMIGEIYIFDNLSEVGKVKSLIFMKLFTMGDKGIEKALKIYSVPPDQANKLLRPDPNSTEIFWE